MLYDNYSCDKRVSSGVVLFMRAYLRFSVDGTINIIFASPALYEKGNFLRDYALCHDNACH